MSTITRRGTLVLHGTRRSFSEERVVRIRLGFRTYAYVCGGGPRLGSLVRVHAPLSGTVTRRVLGFGRGGWQGPLKRATLVHK